jgi:fucose 4-O-acetylase-like acetyltransferase
MTTGGKDRPGGHRLPDIDQAKGLAIVLVVFGHIVARGLKPIGADWYFVTVHHLYSFHMAFFFFLSGFVYFHRAQMPKTLPEYLQDARKRFMRFAPAYFLLAAVVLIGKYLAQSVVHVDRRVSFDVAELSALVLYPTESYVSFLWFIVVLYLIYLLVPLVFHLARQRAWMATCIAFALFWIPLGKVLALHQVGRYTLFFVLGSLAATNLAGYRRLIDHWLPLWLAAFATVLVCLPLEWLPLPAGLLSIPALHGLVRRLPRVAGPALALLGSMVLPIYLLNTLAIGTAKAIALKFVPWDGGNFLMFAPLLTGAGLLIPIAVKKLVFSRIPALDRIT